VPRRNRGVPHNIYTTPIHLQSIHLHAKCWCGMYSCWVSSHEFWHGFSYFELDTSMSICGCFTKTSWENEGRLRTPCHTSNSKLNGKGINDHMSGPHSLFWNQVPGPLYMHHHKWSWDVNGCITGLGQIGFMNHARNLVYVCELVLLMSTYLAPTWKCARKTPPLYFFMV